MDGWGLAGIIVFYLLILFVGIFAAWYKTRKTKTDEKLDENIIVAGRDIGMFVGIFTMIATWVGGGYINGTAEVVFNSGVIWAQAPIGYALSLLLGGLLFARKMRERKYLTMIDPFQEKYGRYIGGLMYLPALCGEVLWSAAILNALGASVNVILKLENFTFSIIVSALIAVFYTFTGGLYSVAYTDVLQLTCIAIGLTLCIPFAWTNDLVDWSKASTNVTEEFSLENIEWLGSVSSDSIGAYVDQFLLLIMGGLPWQVYFQRVLSTKTVFRAQLLSFIASFGCILAAIPPILIGVIARYTDWEAIYGVNGTQRALDEATLVLPVVINRLTPNVVRFIGLGAVSAAVMSSSDSSILSASSMFAHNIFNEVIMSGKASPKTTVWVLRFTVIVVGALACTIGILVGSVSYLWWLCSDLVYVILFPQLLLVIYYPGVNSYGALLGYLVGLVVRLLGGEAGLGFTPIINPGNFPLKTFAMLCNMFFIIVGSAVASLVFEMFKVSKKFDLLQAFPENKVQKANWQELWNVDKGSQFRRVHPVSESSEGVGNSSFQTDV